ncbi:MAG: hypothetical protein M3Y82_04800 [Verrucomicrobiota bacterium]|nr:hypothetical protein [Verrucomicrobiota bacterium]
MNLKTKFQQASAALRQKEKRSLNIRFASAVFYDFPEIVGRVRIESKSFREGDKIERE